MRKAILGAASAIVFASPAMAADLPIIPRSEIPSYEGEVDTYRAAPPVAVEEPAPVVVVRRPVVVAQPPVLVDEYPVYVAPRVYATPRVYAARSAYAYGGPVWRNGHGHHFRGRW